MVLWAVFSQPSSLYCCIHCERSDGYGLRLIQLFSMFLARLCSPPLNIRRFGCVVSSGFSDHYADARAALDGWASRFDRPFDFAERLGGRFRHGFSRLWRVEVALLPLSPSGSWLLYQGIATVNDCRYLLGDVPVVLQSCGFIHSAQQPTDSLQG